MKMYRRLLALLLAFSMSLSMVVPAYASETETVAQTEPAATVAETVAVSEPEETAAATTEATEPPVIAEETEEDPALNSEIEGVPGVDDAGDLFDDPLENAIFPDWTWNQPETCAVALVELTAGKNTIAIVHSNVHIVQNGTVLGSFNGTEEEPAVFEMELGFSTVMMIMMVKDGYQDEFTGLGRSPQNPLYLQWQWNEDETEATATFTAFGQHYIAIPYGYGALELWVNGYMIDTFISTQQIPAIASYSAYPETEVVLTLVKTAMPAAPGSRENPLYLDNWVWNEAHDRATTSVTVEPGTTTWFQSYTAANMELYINSRNPILMKVEEGMPAVFGIPNDSTEAMVIPLTLADPENPYLGSARNPETLVTGGPLQADVPAGGFYFYNWTAPEDGELTIAMTDDEDLWVYTIENVTAGRTYPYNFAVEEKDPSQQTYPVNKGDQIRVVISTCDEKGHIPAGIVNIYTVFVAVVGSEENPLLPDWQWNSSHTEATATFIARPGMTYFEITESGMLLSIDGMPGVAVNATPEEPVILYFENGGNYDMTVTLRLYYPDGTETNPRKVEAGQTTAELETGSQGMFYKFIAPDSGDVKLSIVNPEEPSGWHYRIICDAVGFDEEYFSSDDSRTVGKVIEGVGKGDVVTIYVNTHDPAAGTAPAGSVTFEVEFFAKRGTQTNPITLTDLTQYYFYDICAGETLYYEVVGIRGMDMAITPQGGHSNLVLELDGECYYPDQYGTIYLNVPANNEQPSDTPVKFAVTNLSEDFITSYVMNFWYPVGSFNNPAYMGEGKQSIKLAEDAISYYYYYDAQKNGYLTISANSGSKWVYGMGKYNNRDLPIFEIMRYASSDKSPATIYVEKGERIMLMVGKEKQDSAATLNFTVTFGATQVSMLAGKTQTLKFIHPETGKSIGATQVNWQITEGEEYVSSFRNGSLTAAKGLEEKGTVKVLAALKADEGITNLFEVEIWPAVTGVEIHDENGQNITGKTVPLFVNRRNQFLPFEVVLTPNTAQTDNYTFALSNMNIAGIAWVNGPTGLPHVVPITNPKTGKAGTGNVTLTAKALDGSNKSATLKVALVNAVNELEITSKTGDFIVGVGKTLNLTANVNKDASNKNVIWSIEESYEEYASIDASGRLTGKKPTNQNDPIPVNAIAADGGKTEATEYVTVTALASSVQFEALTTNTIDMRDVPEFDLDAFALDAEGQRIPGNHVSWKSSNTKSATVDRNGTVTCLKPGKVTITASTTDGSNKKATVSITIVKSPSSIVMSSEEVLATGKTLTLKPVVLDADASNKKLDWFFTAESRAAVDAIGAKISNGRLTMDNKKSKTLNTPVELTVVAASQMDQDVYAECVVSVYPITTGVTLVGENGLEIKSAKLNGCDTITLKPVTVPSSAAGQYSWKSSNESVATVVENDDGSVTIKAVATKNAKATITATALDGSNKKATFTVDVTVNAVRLVLDDQHVAAGKTLQLAKLAKFLDREGNVITPKNTKIKWTLWYKVGLDGKPVVDPSGPHNWKKAPNNKCAAGTLNATTGAFSATKNSPFDEVTITAEYVNDDGETIFLESTDPVQGHEGIFLSVFPDAVKGVSVYGFANDGMDEDNYLMLDKKTVTTTARQVCLQASVTNWEDNCCSWDFEFTSNNKAFEIVYEDVPCLWEDEDGNQWVENVPMYVVRAVDPANPYGTVKVTIKAKDGSNASTHCTIKFVAP